MPDGGARGQLREAPIFTATTQLNLAGADLATLAAADHTLMLWVHPEFDLPTDQTLLQQNGLALKRAADNRLTFCDGSTATTVSSVLLPLNRWTHVAAVQSNGTRTLYINGQPDVSATVQSVAGNCAGSTAQIGGNFLGRLDEIAVYNQPLIAAEISRQFAYQSRWFDARIRPVVLIDNDPPTIEVHAAGTYLNGADGQKLLFTVEDTGMGVDYMTSPTITSPEGYTYLLTTPANITSTTFIATMPDGLLRNGGDFVVEVSPRPRWVHCACDEDTPCRCNCPRSHLHRTKRRRRGAAQRNAQRHDHRQQEWCGDRLGARAAALKMALLSSHSCPPPSPATVGRSLYPLAPPYGTSPGPS
ncbi:MAG: LamG domain-containing protein [Caldilineaceae bacterium]